MRNACRKALSTAAIGIALAVSLCGRGVAAAAAPGGAKEGQSSKALVGWSAAVPSLDGAAEFYVAPDGKADAAGTKEAPWDIASALTGKQKVPEGSIIWIRAGLYVAPGQPAVVGADPGLQVALKGTPEKPIHVRAYPGERATVEGAITYAAGSRNVWVWDLELMVRLNVEKGPLVLTQTGSFPMMDRRQGGLTIWSGEGHKAINLVVHHNSANGFFVSSGAPNAEIHGTLIYENGWTAPDRQHGHAIYAQNEKGQDLFTDNIIFANMHHDLHLYGSGRAHVEHFTVEGNILFGPDPKGAKTARIAGGAPSKDITVKNNLLSGETFMIGGSGNNEDGVVEGNTLVRGDFAMAKWTNLSMKDNTVWKNGPPADKTLIVLRLNKYDPNRANLAIVNGPKAEKVAVDLGPFLKKGEKFRIQSATDFFGKPVLSDTYSGQSVAVPIPDMPNTPSKEFAAFVVLK